MSVVVKRFCKTSVQSTYVDTLLRMAYDILYKNAVVHGCMWYKQNAPLRDRGIPHLDTHEDKFLCSSAY